MMTTVKAMIGSERRAHTGDTVKPVVDVVTSRQSRSGSSAGRVIAVHERIRKSVDDALGGVAGGGRRVEVLSVSSRR